MLAKAFPLVLLNDLLYNSLFSFPRRPEAGGGDIHGRFTEFAI